MNDTAAAAEAPAPHDASAGWGSEAFDLVHPFRFAGMIYAALKIRVPSGADIEAYLAGADTSLRALALRLCDADEKIMAAMHGADYARLLKTVGEFIAGLR